MRPSHRTALPHHHAVCGHGGEPGEQAPHRLQMFLASPPRTSRAEKRINGPPPQPSLPAVRHAIVDLILRPPSVQKYVRAAGVVSDETVTAFGIPHFQFSGRHRVLFPLRLQPSTCGPPTSYSRFNRSVIISQKPCNSALLRTGPASTPNVSRQIPWVSPAKHKRDNAEAIFS